MTEKPNIHRDSLHTKIEMHLNGNRQEFSADDFYLYGIDGVLAKHMPRLISNLSSIKTWFSSAKYHHIYNFFGYLDEIDRINDKEKHEEALRRAAEKKLEINNARIAAEKAQLEEQISIAQHVAEKHKDTLTRKRNQIIYLDDYGKEVGNIKWLSEVEYFITQVVGINISDKNISALVNAVDDIARSNAPKQTSNQKTSSHAIGYQFESECASLLADNGWLVTRTKSTGDQGVDLIANIESISVAVQCKKYSTPVGNKAVQEIYAGASFVQTDFCAVVSNTSFTISAKQLAQKLGVLLLHKKDLPNLLKIINNTDQ